MNAVTAALGIAQMERIDELIAFKRRLFGWYRERLGRIPGIEINAEPPGVENSYWMITIVPNAARAPDKFALMAALDKRNIDTRPFFSPLSSLPAFAGRHESKRFVRDTDVGQRIARVGVNLPSGYQMTEERVDMVCRALAEVLREYEGGIA
jgi:perosamine synthetase